MSPAATDVNPAQQTVAVCRPAAQAGGLIARLRQLGLNVAPFPLIEVVNPDDGGAALRAALGQLERFSMVAFTSANAVAAVTAALADLARTGAKHEWPDSTATAAVGEASAAAVVEAGFPDPFVPTIATAAELSAQVSLPVDVSDRPVLAPLAELASDDLVRGIVERGGAATRVTAYRTKTVSYDVRAVHQVASSDFAVVTSPSIARELAALLGSAAVSSDVLSMRPRVVAIGPRTAESAHNAGLSVVATADPHDDDGLVAALEALIGSAP